MLLCLALLEICSSSTIDALRKGRRLPASYPDTCDDRSCIRRKRWVSALASTKELPQNVQHAAYYPSLQLSYIRSQTSLTMTWSPSRSSSAFALSRRWLSEALDTSTLLTLSPATTTTATASPSPSSMRHGSSLRMAFGELARLSHSTSPASRHMH